MDIFMGDAMNKLYSLIDAKIYNRNISDFEQNCQRGRLVIHHDKDPVFSQSHYHEALRKRNTERQFDFRGSSFLDIQTVVHLNS